MRTLLGGSAVLALGVFVVACSGSSSSAPASPSGPSQPANSVPIASLKVTGAPLVVGDTVQFTATAKMTDQTSQEVTNLATWSSSDVTLATVNAAGQVTALKVGGVTIRAAYRGMTDSQYENVTPLVFYKAGGTVTDAPPGFAAVPGTTIEITVGNNKGMLATSDGAGNFSFGTLKGDNYTFVARHDGYLDTTKTVTLTRDQPNISILMFPIPPPGATARCKDKSWSTSTDKASACSRNGGVAYWACPGPFC